MLTWQGDRDPAIAGHMRALQQQRVADRTAKPNGTSATFPDLADGALTITDGQGGLLLDAYSRNVEMLINVHFPHPVESGADITGHRAELAALVGDAVGNLKPAS